MFNISNMEYVGEIKVQNFCMYLKLSCFQLEVDCGNKFYASLIATTKKVTYSRYRKIEKSKYIAIKESPSHTHTQKIAREEERNKKTPKETEYN